MEKPVAAKTQSWNTCVWLKIWICKKVFLTQLIHVTNGVEYLRLFCIQKVDKNNKRQVPSTIKFDALHAAVCTFMAILCRYGIQYYPIYVGEF